MQRLLAPLATLAVFLAPALAYADKAGGPGHAGGVGNPGYIAIAVGLTMGLGILGGALGQGRAAGSVLEGICRNPAASKESFVPMILGLALIESLVIFGLVVAFQLLDKMG